MPYPADQLELTVRCEIEPGDFETSTSWLLVIGCPARPLVGGLSKLLSDPAKLLFQRIKQKNNRYQSLKQIVVEESKHTITLQIVSVKIRYKKSAVAEKRMSVPKG